MWKKFLFTFLFALCFLSAAETVRSEAAESAVPVGFVSLSVDSNTDAGGELNISITSSSGRYAPAGYEFVGRTAEDWRPGDVPRIKITVEAAEGYYFDKINSSGKMNVNGADYVSVRTIDEQTLEVTVKLDPIRGTLSSPENVYWDSDDRIPLGKAAWDKVDGAGSYEVKLYLNGQPVYGQDRINANKINLFPYITKPGVYEFRVRALPKTGQGGYIEKSEWSFSDEMDVLEDSTFSFRPAKPQQTGWLIDSQGWWYLRQDGSYPSGVWELINGRWYLFDSAGYMLTGWQYNNGRWYYLHIPSGDMVADTWSEIGGKWYLFDSGGAMMTGWQLWKDRWYYLNEASGDMAVHTWIGTYYVGSDGAWIPAS